MSALYGSPFNMGSYIIKRRLLTHGTYNLKCCCVAAAAAHAPRCITLHNHNNTDSDTTKDPTDQTNRDTIQRFVILNLGGSFFRPLLIEYPNFKT